MTTRRRFLLSAGGGALALAAGGGAELLGEQRERSATKAVREAADQAARPGPPVTRFGTRRIVWSTRPAGAYAAISFDDGPTPEFTPRILAALDEAGVRATFNVMGTNAVAHRDVLRDVVAAGHEIGNHTWSHLDQSQIAPAQIREELVRCKDEVEQLLQRPLVGFRPPRGELSGYAAMVAAELGYDVFLWSCTRGPGGISDVPTVAAAIGGTLAAGDIIDLHDGIGRGTFDPTASFARGLAARRDVEVRALPEALRRIADRGIALASVTDLLARSEAEPLPTWRAPSGAH